MLQFRYTDPVVKKRRKQIQVDGKEVDVKEVLVLSRYKRAEWFVQGAWDEKTHDVEYQIAEDWEAENLEIMKLQRHNSSFYATTDPRDDRALQIFEVKRRDEDTKTQNADLRWRVRSSCYLWKALPDSDVFARRHCKRVVIPWLPDDLWSVREDKLPPKIESTARVLEKYALYSKLISNKWGSILQDMPEDLKVETTFYCNTHGAQYGPLKPMRQRLAMLLYAKTDDRMKAELWQYFDNIDQIPDQVDYESWRTREDDPELEEFDSDKDVVGMGLRDAQELLDEWEKLDPEKYQKLPFYECMLAYLRGEYKVQKETKVEEDKVEEDKVEENKVEKKKVIVVVQYTKNSRNPGKWYTDVCFPLDILRPKNKNRFLDVCRPPSVAQVAECQIALKESVKVALSRYEKRWISKQWVYEMESVISRLEPKARDDFLYNLANIMKMGEESRQDSHAFVIQTKEIQRIAMLQLEWNPDSTNQQLKELLHKLDEEKMTVDLKNIVFLCMRAIDAGPHLGLPARTTLSVRMQKIVVCK